MSFGTHLLSIVLNESGVDNLHRPTVIDCSSASTTVEIERAVRKRSLRFVVGPYCTSTASDFIAETR